MLRHEHNISESVNGLTLLVFLILMSIVLAACNGATSQVEVVRSEPAIDPVLTVESAGTAAPNRYPTTEPTTKLSDLIIGLDPQALGGATYSGILDEAVTLVDGRYEGEPFVVGGASRPTITLLPEPVAYGDLDGDGRMDAAVVMVSDSGGSGTFIYLAVVESLDGTPFNVATTLLGDRDQIRTLTIDGGRLLVNLLSHAADDPACCPSLETTRTFRLREGLLVEETAE